MRSEEEKRRRQSAEYVKLVTEWLDKLTGHFNATLEEEQIKVYLDALARDSDHQINTAFERCLNECEFMPKLREVHEKMPEDREEHKVWYARPDKPTLEYARPYARVAARQLFGMELDDIEAGPRRMKCFFYGERARAESRGIDTSKWPQWDDSMEKLLEKFKPKTFSDDVF